MNDSVDKFILRIEKFIDKYYKCLLLNGFSTCFFVFITTLIFLSFLEYFFHFSTTIRFVFLILFIAVNSILFINKVCLPFLRLLHILPRISYAEACRLIQNEIIELHDVPLNIVELLSYEQSALTTASIVQKIEQTNKFNFLNSITYKFKRLVFFVFVPLVVFCFLLCFCSSLFSDGLLNIIRFSNQSSEQVFYVRIDDSKLCVEQGSDLKIDAVVFSKYPKSDVFINLSGGKFIMDRQNDSIFSYVFKNVNNEFKFSISTSGFTSDSYSVKVIRVPVINNYTTDIYYPKYVNKSDTTVENQNILIVPQGTFVKQTFHGSFFDTLKIISLTDSSKHLSFTGDTFTFRTRVLKNLSYRVTLSNSDVNRDFIDFKIICVPDLYPNILIFKSMDQTTSDHVVFDGSIKDDYGFSKLSMYVSGNGVCDTFLVPIYPNITSQQIYYDYYCPIESDISDQTLLFSFELFDNDAVNGPKKVRSSQFDHIVKSISNKAIDKENQYADIFRKLELSRQLSNDIEFEIAELRKKILNDNLTDWEKNSMLQQISSQTNQLQNFLNEISKAHNSIENTFSRNQQIIEKQNLISEMLSGLVDDELKQILNEISQLANEQQQYNTLSEDLKHNFTEFEKSIDKDLELLRKIKMEENMQQLADNLNILSDKQKQLSQSINDSLQVDVAEQSLFFNNLQNQYQQMMEDNQLLERPMNIGDFTEQFIQIKSNFDIEKQYINDNSIDKFNIKSKENADQIKQLSDSIKSMLDMNTSNSDAEDADELRQILDNLFEISFNQERIITEYENVNYTNPLYQNRILEQSKLVENFKILRDSLYNLSRRTVYLGNHISKAAFLIEDGMMKSCLQLQERNEYKANQNQRESLKNSNDLILILSESLKNIDNAASGSGGKPSKRKKKPSEQKQSLSDMRGAQESLKNQMRDLLNQMKNGDTGKTNRELVKTLMQNEIYQQMLEQMMYNADIDSQTAKLLKEVKQLMEKTHNEISNKKLSIQTVMRQQSIVTKLLEAENAELERDKEEKRESTSGKNITRKIHENWQEDITFEKNIDVLKQTDLRLNSFYKTKFEEYLDDVNKMNNE